MIKLIIWDLDETLWRGTLAEGDDVQLLEQRSQFVRQLNRNGIVSSICSKNDRQEALRKLDELGLKEQFVFPEIAFSAKGPLVEKIIKDMNLRAPDVMFIDDNIHNLEEVRSVVPDIQTMDATSPECDDYLAQLVAESEGGKSRLEKYRIMERKREDRALIDGPNEEFLRQSGIRMTVVRTHENLPFASRIEELINRTNQLNYLKSRVQPGLMAPFIVDLAKNLTYSLFVWDKYGNYGLVGFAFVRANTKALQHFTFSCRIMNMGVEESFAYYLSHDPLGPHVPEENLPVQPNLPEWVTFVPSEAGEAKAAIEQADISEFRGDSRLRIMANCQSGAIAHYMHNSQPVVIDNWPHAFRLCDWVSSRDMKGPWKPLMVYGAFVDYHEAVWEGEEGVIKYRSAVSEFLTELDQAGSDLIVLLPADVSRNSADTVFDYRRLNDTWRDEASRRWNVVVMNLEEYSTGIGADPRHFNRDAIVSIAKGLAKTADASVQRRGEYQSGE
ncbi:HAD-IIIC family phosphatase [Corynebacterium sp. NML120713]|uniref:HAD-IIIC family phosphatase n=1 Tax=Corynebacterium sp. NML120713 TaxID=1906332 RepID=UPI0008FB0841|nr:HAD-IIIC family phosphatase [Corynebacterium sp. NML120713]OIR42914.1 hypothetical protein BJP06_07895 [Corynebacterium sp. NML120713]